MLPQFGYIVAQAGADSHLKNKNSPPPYYSRPILPPPPSSFEYYRPYDYRPLQPLPPWDRPSQSPLQLPLPQEPPKQSTIWQNTQPIKEFEFKKQVQPEPPRWEPEEPVETIENQTSRKLRESNDLIQWMDTEFWEQCDEVYNEKLESLQQEIVMIQLGTHFAFKQTLSDFELKRQQTIEHADYFREYEISLIQRQYEQEIELLEKEYQNEKISLHEIVLQAIEEKRKLIKEDKEENIDINDLFKDTYNKINNKRNLRKRMPYDKNGQPSRHERRKREKQIIPHNIHATPSTLEEDELESDFILMKGGNPAKRQTTQQKR